MSYYDSTLLKFQQGAKLNKLKLKIVTNYSENFKATTPVGLEVMSWEVLRSTKTKHAHISCLGSWGAPINDATLPLATNFKYIIWKTHLQFYTS